MKNLFPGYYRPSEADFKSLWTNAPIALDANVLLNILALGKSPARRVLTHRSSALRSLRDRGAELD